MGHIKEVKRGGWGAQATLNTLGKNTEQLRIQLKAVGKLDSTHDLDVDAPRKEGARGRRGGCASKQAV